jgi:hypothetical protein
LFHGQSWRTNHTLLSCPMKKQLIIYPTLQHVPALKRTCCKLVDSNYVALLSQQGKCR